MVDCEGKRSQITAAVAFILSQWSLLHILVKRRLQCTCCSKWWPVLLSQVLMAVNPLRWLLKTEKIRNEQHRAYSVIKICKLAQVNRKWKLLAIIPTSSQVTTLAMGSPTVDYTTALVMRWWAVIECKINLKIIQLKASYRRHIQ